MRTDTLFLTLNTFSATGGIEKVCRVAGKAMFEFSTRFQKRLKIWSMHDEPEAAGDNTYFPSELYRGFAGDKMKFVKAACEQGLQSRLIILSHVNLLPVGWLIKRVKPAAKLVLLCHGIEIWGEIGFTKKNMLPLVDEFWAVSQYTKKCIEEQHGIDPDHVKVLNNCLDPYLPLRRNVEVPPVLFERYQIKPEEKILLTIARLSGTEKYKGYDDVIRALPALKDKHIKYILGGKADEEEKSRLTVLINELGLQEQVIVPGFIAEDELAAHFKLCDGYIMPSSKEGFGIVFIEAMHYGAPVIAGNADGSTDALMNGQLGLLVTPGNVQEIQEAIALMLNDPSTYQPDETLLDQNFSYLSYKKKLSRLMLSLYNETQRAEALF